MLGSVVGGLGSFSGYLQESYSSHGCLHRLRHHRHRHRQWATSICPVSRLKSNQQTDRWEAERCRRSMCIAREGVWGVDTKTTRSQYPFHVLKPPERSASMFCGNRRLCFVETGGLKYAGALTVWRASAIRLVTNNPAVSRPGTIASYSQRRCPQVQEQNTPLLLWPKLTGPGAFSGRRPTLRQCCGPSAWVSLDLEKPSRQGAEREKEVACERTAKTITGELVVGFDSSRVVIREGGGRVSMRKVCRLALCPPKESPFRSPEPGHH